MGTQGGWRCCGCMDFIRNDIVFIRYLGAEAFDAAHVLQFWSQRISIGGTSYPRVRHKKKQTKKTQGLEILSEGVLRTSRRAQRGELPRITIFLYSQCLPTPPELRDRSIWSFRGGFYWNFTPDRAVDDYWEVRFRAEIWTSSFDISELSEPLELILHSFVVLTSTIEL